ncbi:MAG TPA: ATP-dependent helicase [Candidatus Eisenbacteria bacterium]|nr:ATP-dependent helicase [Candidatus Eisenbacteria bacterium]
MLERLARLAPDQRAAATATPGPVLCVAPAGSGKTTTLVARIAWLIDEGADPGSICAVTFNRRAAEELRERVNAALAPLDADPVRIRTFHALGLEILRAADQAVEPLVDRDEVLRSVRPEASLAERRRLDTVISRFKLDLDIDPAAIEADPEAGPVARTYAAYEREIARRGGLDFDDLVARALRLLASDAAVLERWRAQCAQLLVDEAQDLDRSQLRMALLLAAPANRIFLVGDDDQSIYGWRLADVRRLLRLADESLAGLRRVDLEVNYRCPAVVLDRAVRLVEHNEERFTKVIRARDGASGSLVLAPTSADDLDRAAAVLASWGSPLPDVPASSDHAVGPTFAILARTNRELIPATIAALQAGRSFRFAGTIPLEAPEVGEILRCAAAMDRSLPLLVRLGRTRDVDAGTAGWDEIVGSMLGWAAGYRDLEAFRAAIEDARGRLAALRRDDAALSLATAHGTKGLEFDHVAVVGMDAGRFPSARSVAEAVEPERALEEERRLAYVAWTRARRSLTLVYDPEAPSPFLLEAFTPDELGVEIG